MRNSSFSIIIPIYNEEEILEIQTLKLINEVERILPNAEYEIILVENGSSDRTLHLARRLAKKNSHIKVLPLKKPSYGQAFKEGVKAAEFNTIIQFDIDFWDMDFLDMSVLLLQRYDFVIGSKNLGISKDGRPLFRRILSKALEFFLKLYFGVPFSDTHGMKAMKRNMILPLLDEIKSTNHFFDSELLILCYYLKYSFKEVPVQLHEIRNTRFSFLVRSVEVLKEFAGLMLQKRLLIRFSYS